MKQRNKVLSKWFIALLGVASFLLSGCSPGAKEDRPNIVVTTSILADVVTNMVGNQAVVHTLMPANVDPHSFEISAQQAGLLQSADLVISNGLNLEEGLGAQLREVDSTDVTHFVATDYIQIRSVPGEKGQGDPHFWTDPAQTISVAQGLETQLGAIPGIDPVRLTEQSGGYLKKLQELDAQLEASFAAIPKERRKMVSNHHVFGYLAARFDMEIIGAIIPSGTTLASPSAADLASLTAAIREAQVPAIFVESAQPDKLARALANESKLEVQIVELYTESLSLPGQGAESYLQMMNVNAEKIGNALRN